PGLSRQGEVLKIVIGIRFLLPSRGIEVLRKIPLLIQKTNACERDAQIARGLQMITGQDTQASSEDGQTLGQAELGREIGHLQTVEPAIRALIPSRFR